MRTWMLAASLAMAIGFAGCASEPTDEVVNDVTPQGGNSTVEPELNGTVPEVNETTGEQPLAPTWPATFSADVVQGEAPLGVRFDFEVAGNWTLDLDGEGLNVEMGSGNGSYSYVYVEVGVHQAQLHFEGGQLNLTITALAPPIVWTGSVTSPDPFAVMGGGCIMPLADFFGTGAWGPLENLSPGHDGWLFAATPGTVWVTFIDAAGNIKGSGNSGTVGAGATQAMICATDALVDFTVTVSPP